MDSIVWSLLKLVSSTYMLFITKVHATKLRSNKGESWPVSLKCTWPNFKARFYQGNHPIKPSSFKLDTLAIITDT